MGLDADQKRGIYLLLIGMIVSLFIMFNSTNYLQAGGLYAILGAVTIMGYLIWNRI